MQIIPFQSTVSRLEKKYSKFEYRKDAPKPGRPTVHEDIQQDVILSAVENSTVHCGFCVYAMDQNNNNNNFNANVLFSGEATFNWNGQVNE